MQNFKLSRSFLVFSALGLALMPLCGAVQAKPKDGSKGGPPDFAPAYGRRNRDRDRDGGRLRRDDFGSMVTLEGIVTRIDSSSSNTDRFRVQAGGRSFDVFSDSSVRLRQGQRVVLRGAFDNDDNFRARTVTILGRGNDVRRDDDQFGNDYRPGIDQRVNFPGVVTRVRGDREFDVRADNGRTYRVELRNESDELQVGNRIRVTGTAYGNRVQNARVTFQNGGVVGPIFGERNNGSIFGNGGIFGNRDNDGSLSTSYGQKVNFSGQIFNIDKSRRTATLRGDNGRDYRIQGSQINAFRNGDRVRVFGVTQNGVIVLSDVDPVD